MCDANGNGDTIYVDTVRLSVLEAASPSEYDQWASDQGLGAAESVTTRISAEGIDKLFIQLEIQSIQ